MRYLWVAVFLITSCGGGKGTTPDAVDRVESCYSNYGSQTCRVVFDDGQRGYTVQQFGGGSYMCKGNL